MELRRFTGIEYPEPVIRECNRYQNGRLATFQIYVKFRYNASWQGDITWLEGEQTESFESLLQMLQMIDRIFTGQSKERGTRFTKICQIASNSDVYKRQWKHKPSRIYVWRLVHRNEWNWKTVQ